MRYITANKPTNIALKGSTQNIYFLFNFLLRCCFQSSARDNPFKTASKTGSQSAKFRDLPGSKALSSLDTADLPCDFLLNDDSACKLALRFFIQFS